MNSIEQIVRQLTGIDSRSDGHISRMERERSYILENMDKIQSVFGNQPAGQELVKQLYGVINEVGMADSAMNELKSEIRRLCCRFQR